MNHHEMVRAITVIVIVSAIAVLGLYDIAVYWLYGETTTITYVVRSLKKVSPIAPELIAFAMGVLFGHLFCNGGK